MLPFLPSKMIFRMIRKIHMFAVHCFLNKEVVHQKRQIITIFSKNVRYFQELVFNFENEFMTIGIYSI